MIESYAPYFLALSLIYLGYLVLPFLKPANALGNVTHVEKVFRPMAGLYQHIPTIEFVDTHGKKHTIVGSRWLPRSIEKYWSGQIFKVYYHPDAPQRASLPPRADALFVSVMFVAATAFFTIMKQL